MKTILSLLFTIIIFSVQALRAQNTDLLASHVSGKQRGMAGAGIALANGVAAVDFNPAGVANTTRVSFATTLSTTSHRYSLFRQNVDQWAFEVKWNKSNSAVDNIGAAFPASRRLSLGLGYFRKINPFTDNDQRAITGSSLLHQTTSGGVYALTLAAGLKITGYLMAGIAFSKNFGTITSRIRGDNHGRETHKSAVLESDLDGMNARIGAMVTTKKISAGITVSSPARLQVETHTQISENREYEAFFPDYERLDWKLPMIVGVGFAYTGYRDWTFALDFESHRFEKSEVQLNLYEFGGRPNWKTANVLRAGIEFYPFHRKRLPLRLGYARLPQLYASNRVTEAPKGIQAVDAKQNVKHRFAAGTTLAFANFALNLGAEYSFLAWHRQLQTGATILDDYREKAYAAFGELVYYW